jgi:hypothetical protein
MRAVPCWVQTARWRAWRADAYRTTGAIRSALLGTIGSAFGVPGLLLLLIDLVHLPGAERQPPLRVHTYEDDADFTLNDDDLLLASRRIA